MKSLLHSEMAGVVASDAPSDLIESVRVNGRVAPVGGLQVLFLVSAHTS